MNMYLQSLPMGFLQNLGWPEITIIVLFGLLIFGGKKLPELARGAGQAIREFKKASKSAEDTFKQALHEDEEEKKAESKKEAKTEPKAEPKKEVQPTS